MLKAQCCILSLGAENLTRVGELAVLNANFVRWRLDETLAARSPCLAD